MQYRLLQHKTSWCSKQDIS